MPFSIQTKYKSSALKQGETRTSWAEFSQYIKVRL